MVSFDDYITAVKEITEWNRLISERANGKNKHIPQPGLLRPDEKGQKAQAMPGSADATDQGRTEDTRRGVC